MTSSSQFNASDWVYVADSMGRLGQGYYKNKHNPSQTISVSEYENRRRSASQTPAAKEQKENIVPTQPALPGDEEKTAEPSVLTPWDNPVVGEQTVTPEQKVEEEKLKPAAVSKKGDEPSKTEKPQEDKSNRDHHNDNPFNDPATGLGGNDNGADSKVICTELVRQGLMSERARQLCTIYANRHLDDAFLRGYHFWAVPCVRLMRRSNSVTRVIAFLTKCRTQEVAYRMKASVYRSLRGWVCCTVHDRLCKIMGRWVRATPYQDILYAKAA